MADHYVNGELMDDARYEAWLEELQETVEAEMVAAAAEEAAREATRPLEAAEVLAALVQATQVADALPDEVVARMAPYFAEWDEGADYSAGDRVSSGEAVWRCLQAHHAQLSWEPGAAPSLWARVLAGQDGSEPGPWEQPDSANPYMRGDRVTFEGKVWESTVDNNVWSPAAYPAGWSEVAQ